MDKIRVLLADDHVILREGVNLLLSKADDIEVVGEASDGREAVEKVKQLVPDVVLMDITMPGINGLEATQQIKASLPQIKVLVLTMHDTNQYLGGMLSAGVSGYVVKTTSPDELLSAIRAVASGDVYLYPSIARMLVGEYLKKVEEGDKKTSYEILTEREREILKYIAEDMKNKEIADKIGVSVRTVQAHRTNLMDKIGAHDRTELVKYAISKGLIKL